MPDHIYDRLRTDLADRYRLVRELGRGGAGIVYLARDLKHDRDVALKVLRPEMAEAAGDRFLQEIQIAARLSHPHILPLFDSGEAGGSYFYAMPHVEGESLADRLSRETHLDVEEAIRIAREVADGLAHAHDKGVVHRDIKPENILLSGRHALIADFGVARALAEAGGPGLTATGLVVGTATYMSPEQATGHPRPDARSDVYALGCVLYEALAGTPPFVGASPQAVMARHAVDPVPRLRTVRAGIPEPVERVVMRALAKVPADRYRSAAAFGEALARAARADGEAGVVADDRARVTVARVAWLVALGVVAGLTWVAVSGDRNPSSPFGTAPGGAAPAVAVLPFDVTGAGLEEWGEGLANLLATGLDGAGGLRAIPSRTLLARWDELAGAGGRVGQQIGLDLAADLGARYAVIGSGVAIGPEVRVTGDVYATEGRVRLGQSQVEGPPDSVLALADRLSVGVLDILRTRGSGELPPVNLASVTTRSVPALKAYLQGVVFARRSAFDQAIEAYSRALALDSTFALAHYHLASAHAWRQGIQAAAARRHREAALRHTDRLPEREAALVRARHATGEQRAEAVELLERAVEAYPEDSEAWFLLGDAHVHTNALTGPDEADAAFRQATELDPGFALYQPHGVELAFNHHGDSALARLRLDQYGRTSAGSPYHLGGRLALGLAFGSDPDAASMSADTASLSTLATAQTHLKHPDHWEARERVLSRIRELPDEAAQRYASDILALESLWKRGHLGRALEYLGDDRTSTVTRVCLPAVARGWGIPVPPSVLERALALTADESGPVHFVLACRGYIAADLGQWETHEEIVDDALARARRARADGNDALADRLDAAAAELQGYAAWRRGDASEAVRLLENADRVSWYLGPWPRSVIRKADWYPNAWLGLIHLEQGNPGRAEPYLRSLWYSPLAHYHTGLVHEARGDRHLAAGSFRYFVEAWETADPELRPMVEAGQTALARVEEGA